MVLVNRQHPKGYLLSTEQLHSFIHIYVRLQAEICVCMCVSVSVSVCVCVCVCGGGGGGGGGGQCFSALHMSVPPHGDRAVAPVAHLLTRAIGRTLTASLDCLKYKHEMSSKSTTQLRQSLFTPDGLALHHCTQNETK